MTFYTKQMKKLEEELEFTLSDVYAQRGKWTYEEIVRNLFRPIIKQLIKDTIAYCEENTGLEKKDYREFANAILKVSLKEIEWHKDNPDKELSKPYQEGFIKGIEQVYKWVIPPILQQFEEDAIQDYEDKYKVLKG